MAYQVWIENGSSNTWTPSEPMPMSEVLDYLLAHTYGSNYVVTTNVPLRLSAGTQRRARRPHADDSGAEPEAKAQSWDEYQAHLAAHERAQRRAVNRKTASNGDACAVRGN